jgi:tripartite-type tricarboxylate transporter receptor subunit TctC
MKKIRLLVHAIAFLLVWVGESAIAGYPEKPVHILIPFPAGAAADNAMRVVGKKLGEIWGQPVVIDNKPGIPGLQAAAMAVPDGYNLVMAAGSNMVTGPLINSKLPYVPNRDFVPVGRVLINVPVLTVHPSTGVRTLSELVAYAQRKPGALNYSSSGIGSPNHLALEMFQGMTDTKLVHIPYKGAAPSVNEMLAGHVEVGINAVPSVIQHIRSGKLQPLAVASTQRDRNLPNVPTIAEAGLIGFEYEIWYALFAPSKVPKDLIEKISADLQKALTDPEVAKRLIAQGAEPSPSSAEELAKYLQRDSERWKKIIKDRKISMD